MTHIAFTDVQYADTSAVAACVLVTDWNAPRSLHTVTANVSPIAPYEPGAFYKRELPCLLAVLERARALGSLHCIVIDGYVWLDDARSPGLGAHLYEALDRRVPVIGVAKTPYRGSAMAAQLARPGSVKPLFVTSVGLEPTDALVQLSQLHGSYRIPSLMKEVDGLARGR